MVRTIEFDAALDAELEQHVPPHLRGPRRTRLRVEHAVRLWIEGLSAAGVSALRPSAPKNKPRTFALNETHETHARKRKSESEPFFSERKVAPGSARQAAAAHGRAEKKRRNFTSAK